MNNKVHIKKGDTVVLLSGDYKDKWIEHGKEKDKDGNAKKKERRTGKVTEVSISEGKVIVEGINYVTKHVKPKKMGESGGIIKVEAPVYACKVQLVCPKCKKPTRVGHAVEGKHKVRVCKKCGETF